MRAQTILHYLGYLLLIIGSSMLLPLGWSLARGESESTAFILSITITAGVGLILRLTMRPGHRGLSRREAIILVGSGWLVAAAFSALPYYFSGALPTYLDAYFEAMSGYTTTGSTVFTTIDGQPEGIMLWRSLTQWFGGLGIIMFFVALFPLLGVGAAYLVEAETPGQRSEQFTARIRDTARALWLTYVGLSLLEFILLLATRIGILDALTLTLSTLPTGGFAIRGLSVGAYNNLAVEMIVLIFTIAGGINFGLYYHLFWKHRPAKLWGNPELRLYLALLAIATTMIALDLVCHMDMNPGDALRYGGFQVASIMTTTGFTTADFSLWPTFSRVLLLILMLVGASAGSTCGGIKVVRLIVLGKYIHRRLLLFFNPSIVTPIRVGKEVIPEDIISRSIAIVVLYIGVLISGSLIMVALGLDAMTSFSAVAATLGNVGPGLGLVGPMSNFAVLPGIGKGVLIFCMLAGRLELFTILVLLMPAFWRER